jgi:aspartate aminotransferase
MITLASRLEDIQPSASLAIAGEARLLRAAGQEIIDLSVGELDFQAPANVRAAAIRFIELGEIRYGSSAGTLELRAAIAEKFRRDNGLIYTPDEIIVGCGAKQIISSALLATLDPGDEVIIPAPYWTSYPDMVRLAGGTPVIVDTAGASSLRLQAVALRASLTARTKWLIINSPCNPTGVVYRASEIQALARVIDEFPKVGVISDEIYEHMVFPPGEFTSFAAAAPELAERILTVNGVSKSHAMTGWRVGYAAGPKRLIEAINVLQSQTITHTSSVSQHAATEALCGSQEPCRGFAAAMAARAKATVSLVRETAGLALIPPEGGFYCFANCQSFIGRAAFDRSTRIESDADLARYLLHVAGVAVVPGAAYGASPYLRISFAVPEPVIRKGFLRIRDALERLQ